MQTFVILLYIPTSFFTLISCAKLQNMYAPEKWKFPSFLHQFCSLDIKYSYRLTLAMRVSQHPFQILCNAFEIPIAGDLEFRRAIFSYRLPLYHERINVIIDIER